LESATALADLSPRPARRWANTMATALEFLGLSPGGSNEIPALNPAKREAAERAGALVMTLVREDVRPSRIVTRDSLENAITAVVSTGGSTNAVLTCSRSPRRRSFRWNSTTSTASRRGRR
jgi:hypothetical protein